MPLIWVWSCLVGFLLSVAFTTQNKTPDVHVTCMVSSECFLPCSFTPGQKEQVQWSRQDTVVFSFKRDQQTQLDQEDSTRPNPLEGRATIFPHLVANGNATLVIRKGSPRDRGMYRCHVRTADGEHNTYVIVKVEAPIRGLSVELSRLSGYEEMKCTVRNVFPPPRITWSTEPRTFQELQPVTRKQPNAQGLYAVDSRLRMLNGQPDLIYICNATSSYGGPAWTSSLRQREIRGYEGKDVTIPCFAPSYLNSPVLHWNFSNSDEPRHILSYDVRTGRSVSSSSWEGHVELDAYRVQFGDGSLRLMDPSNKEHTGSYTCVFTTPFNVHMERSDVTISGTEKRSVPEEASYWWVMGLVVAILVLAVVGGLVYCKMRGVLGGVSKPKSDPEENTELHPVNDSSGDTPLTKDGTNGQSASALT